MVFQLLKFLVQPSFAAGADDDNPMMQNKSMLKDFLASLMTMSGDLSNITAPPFVLDPKSVVEIPAFWAEDPSVFVSPAKSEDPAERALLVLRSVLAGMKSQCYMGHTEEEGVKKPLNSFLGEVFLGKWEDENGTTRIVSEQVSHHPPITACRVWNEEHGVVAEGFNQQKITFSGSVHIHANGYAIKTIQKFDEHYLIPLPDFKVKGILSGAPYPETSGTYYVPCTSGYMSVINFSGGTGMFGSGTKHGFTAAVYKEADGEDKPIYTIDGAWNTEFKVTDKRTGKEIEMFNVKDALSKLPTLILDPVEEQDPWESRRAWKNTCDAIKRNDMQGTSDAKGALEQGQREMRKDEERDGKTWKPLFFTSIDKNQIAEKLLSMLPDKDSKKSKDRPTTYWKFEVDQYKSANKPYHGELNPDNTRVGEEPRSYRQSISSKRGSVATPRQSISSPRSSISLANGRSNGSEKHIDEKIGAVEDGRPAQIDGTMVDVGREPPKKEIEGITKKQPEPQVSQIDHKMHDLGTGIEGMNVEEKTAVENMLMDTYSSKRT